MRRSAAVLSALLALLLTGACSTTVTGSPAASSASGSDPSSAAEAAPAAPPATATADAGSTGASDTAGGAGAAGSGSFCDAARAQIDQGKSLLDAVTGNGDLNAVIVKVRATTAAFVAAAPPEIQADAQTYSGVSNKELDILASSGGNPAAFVQDSSFRDAVQQAAPATARLAAYLKSHCGIDVDSLTGLGGG